MECYSPPRPREEAPSPRRLGQPKSRLHGGRERSEADESLLARNCQSPENCEKDGEVVNVVVVPVPIVVIVAVVVSVGVMVVVVVFPVRRSVKRS